MARVGAIVREAARIGLQPNRRDFGRLYAPGALPGLKRAPVTPWRGATPPVMKP
jgi:hypothetical protein